MSEQNLEARVAALEKKVAALLTVPPLVGKLIDSAERERNDRLEMCMTLAKFILNAKNAHNDFVKVLAAKPQLFDATDQQELLDHVARMESVFERLEKIIRDAGTPPPPPPGS